MSEPWLQPVEHIEIDGVASAARYGPLAEEVGALRRSVALTPIEHMTCVRISGTDALAVVDRLCPLDLFLRDGQLRQTLLLREDGNPLADVHLACDDESWLLLCEGTPRPQLLAHMTAQLRNHDAEITDLSQTHALLSLNGPFAWELMMALEGEEITAFPYLSFYIPRPNSIYFRAGKTGEFGYELLVPRDERDALLARIREAGHALDLRAAGMLALWQCALENWFFNIHREGTHALTPIELGLQWRISYDKSYIGSEAVQQRRQSGAVERLTALRCPQPLQSGAQIFVQDDPIGRVLHAERSETLDAWLGVGLLQSAYAFSGIDHYRSGATAKDATPITTASAPFINNFSLYVNPQQHRYAQRAEIAYPGPDRDRPQQMKLQEQIES